LANYGWNYLREKFRSSGTVPTTSFDRVQVEASTWIPDYRAHDQDLEAWRMRVNMPGCEVDWPTDVIVSDQEMHVAGYEPKKFSYAVKDEVHVWHEQRYCDGVTPEDIVRPRQAREIVDWFDTIIEGDWFTLGANQFMITGKSGSEFHVRRISG
jgi:hypothetical protein